MNKDRNYSIRVKLNMSGELPQWFSNGNLKELLTSTLDQIEVVSDDEMKVWALLSHGKIDFEISEYEVTYTDNITCEHCNSNELPDFGVQINVSGISWCYNCGEYLLSENDKDNIKREEPKERKKFVKNKIKMLKNELKNLEGYGY